MSDRNGITVTGYLLLHPTDNPSASHPLSTSPYTGEARGGRRQLAQHRVTGRQARRASARPPARAGVRFSAIHLPEIYGILGGPRKTCFAGKSKCPPEPPVRALRGRFLLHPSPASAAGLRFAPAGGRETKDEGGKPGGGKISENRRLTRNGKTDILRPRSNRTRPEGGAQDDQRKHGLVRIGRKEAWTEGALRTHAALRSKTAFFCALSVFLQDGERFFCAFPKISFVL